jgi:hypothetical protein
MTSLPQLAVRIGGIVAAVAVSSLVLVQYEGIAVRYLTLKHEVEQSQADIDGLHLKLRREQARINRLSDPRGAIPEIHDKLKEFGPDEEMIYVRGVPSPPPAWESSH